MREPSEWALEKARNVIEIDGIPDHAPLLQRFARALDEVTTNAKAEEREQCAKIADEHGYPNRFSVDDCWREEQSPSEVYDTAAQDVSFWISDAIRARG